MGVLLFSHPAFASDLNGAEVAASISEPIMMPDHQDELSMEKEKLNKLVAKYVKDNKMRPDEEFQSIVVDLKIKYPAVPLEAVLPVIKKESGGKQDNPNRVTNCIGYCQWMHKYHAAPMKRMGLDIYNGKDNMEYFFIHINDGLAAGKSMDKIMQPWEVWRSYGARKEYLRLKASGTFES